MALNKHMKTNIRRNYVTVSSVSFLELICANLKTLDVFPSYVDIMILCDLWGFLVAMETECLLDLFCLILSLV